MVVLIGHMSSNMSFLANDIDGFCSCCVTLFRLGLLRVVGRSLP